MILSAIVTFLIKIVDAIAKAVAWILVALGLWLPAVFTVAFVIVCAVGKIPLSGAMPFYLFGLALTFIGAVALSLNKRKRGRAKKRRESINYSKLIYKGNDVSMKSAADYDEFEYKSREQKSTKRNEKQIKEIDSADKTAEDNLFDTLQREPIAKTVETSYEDLQKKYFLERAHTSINSQTNSPTGFDTSAQAAANHYHEPSVKKDEAAIEKYYEGEKARLGNTTGDLWKRLESGAIKDEQPLVFATRQNPDIFVYEYSDRLQFYEKTRKGMVLLETKMKKTDRVI